MQDQWNHKVFNVTNEGFEDLTLEVFHFQYGNNAIYKGYTDALHIIPTEVNTINSIPFLPIGFFKSNEILTTNFSPATVFESSGTTGSINSRHLIKELGLYETSFLLAFEMFYGPIKEYCILGLLPSYLERDNSSLVYMVDRLIKETGHPQSGFYLDDYKKLSTLINELEEKKQKTLLIGVTFALLDFAEQFPMPLKHTTILETGGMKGRRREMIREELHAVLQNAFQIDQINSEYGMTELLSQAYSKGDGVFNTPPWMKILLRDEEDPLQLKNGGTGIINVIDLANIYSCSFIATDDAGRIHPNGSFEVLGRIDSSDLRGCSLMTV